jgi:hypothetical protein
MGSAPGKGKLRASVSNHAAKSASPKGRGPAPIGAAIVEQSVSEACLAGGDALLGVGNRSMPGRVSWASLAALLLAAISVVATLSVIDFPLGTLGDEYAKLEAVRTGRYNYFHWFRLPHSSCSRQICSPWSSSDGFAPRWPAAC